MRNKKVILLNPSRGGTARYLKTTYYKVSLANLIHKDGQGVTGVMIGYEKKDNSP